MLQYSMSMAKKRNYFGEVVYEIQNKYRDWNNMQITCTLLTNKKTHTVSNTGKAFKCTLFQTLKHWQTFLAMKYEIKIPWVLGNSGKF